MDSADIKIFLSQFVQICCESCIADLRLVDKRPSYQEPRGNLIQLSESQRKAADMLPIKILLGSDNGRDFTVCKSRIFWNGVRDKKAF